MAEETRIIRIIIDSSKAVDGSAAATRALEKLERSTAAMDTALARMEKGLGGIGTLIKANLALALADFSARMILMAKGAFDAAAGMDELAEQLGVTAKGLQGLQFSAVQSGVKLEQLETGVAKFSQKMGEAAGGSKEMIEALDRIGVKVLDVNGKLRPTETLLQEVSASISAIDDPARRAAAAVDFFGKAGTRMLPMLKDMSGGMDEMAARAKAAGAFIEADTVAKLDKLADSAERSKLTLRAFFAENGAGPLTTTLDGINSLLGKLAGYLRAIRSDWTNLFSHDSNAEQKLNLTIADRESKIRDAEARIAKDPNRAADFRLIDQWRGDIGGARRELEKMDAATGRNVGLVDDVPRSSPLPPPGVSNPPPTGTGQGEADRIDKLTRDTAREVAAATAYAEASERGARAVADLETHFKALKSAQDAYGSTADRNTTQVAALTAKIEEQMKAAERLKNLKDFNLGTEELERANTLLEVENALINASVETRARELALIKLKHEVQSRGLDENNAAEKAAIDRRGAAIEQNERLKAQGEELRKANELWTEPLKNALNSIQSSAANMFEAMLEKGAFSFQELGDLTRKLVRRMVAEFAALAVIRPMLGGVVGGLSAIGLVSPATASSLGYGASGGSGTSGYSMPSFGGPGSDMGSFELPSWLGGGSIGNLMAATPFASAAPTGGFASIEALMASGQAGSSAGWAAGGLGGAVQGLSVGSMLGAGVGIGMGAYSLATSKNTAQTIGGIGQMIGGGMMLIPGMQIPGMVVSALSAILPSLLGGEEYKWAPLAGANVQFNPGAGGYSSTATEQLGGKSIAGQYAGVGQTLDAFFKAAGGITDASKAFAAAIWQNQREGTTSTYEISPSQGSHQLSEGSGDQSAAVDRMIAKVFYNSIQNNAAMNASPTLRTAFSNREPTTTAQISSLFDLIKAYDQLGKETSSAEKALKAISDSFASLTSGANEWGLALAPIEAEQKKRTIRTAQDFIDNMLDPLALQMRALDDQRKEALASAEYIRDNIKDVYVDVAKVAEYYTRKEANLKEQFYGQSVSQLQDAIRRLSLGDLANLSPTTMLTGVRATYQATVAQARSGDSSAIARLASEGTNYATVARQNYASSPEYQAILEGIRSDLAEVQSAIQTPGADGAALNNSPASQAALAANETLRQIVQVQSVQIEDLRNMVASLVAQLQRVAVNQAA